MPCPVCILARLEVRCVEGGKERPQNRNLKPLGSGVLTPEEELAIRRKGKKASDKARRRNADIRAAVQAIANLNMNGAKKSVDVEKLMSVAQLDEDGAPLISRMVYSQFICAINGDKESRNWICKMLGVDLNADESASGVTVTADADAVGAAGGVRVHLIRGEKPPTEVSEEDEATRAAARLATVEAMKAIGTVMAAKDAAGTEVSSDGE